MSNKLTFEEWFFQCEFHKDGYDCNQVSSANSAWSFCQAQEQKEIEELKKKVEELEKTVSSQTEIIYKLENECSFTYKCPVNSNLQKENESLKEKLEKAEEVIGFYGDPEKWMIKTSDYWTKSSPRNYGDSELIEDYSHPNKDWVGSIVVGGKRARAYLKENCDE